MPDYKELYRILFQASTQAQQAMDAGEWLLARRILVKAQQLTEELYIAGEGQSAPEP